MSGDEAAGIVNTPFNLKRRPSMHYSWRNHNRTD